MGGEGASSITGDGNTLTVVLFLLGIAVNFFVPTLKQEEPRVRILFRVIATFLTLMALAWPFFSMFFPAFVASMTTLTSSARAWLILLMVTLIVGSFSPAIEQYKVSQKSSSTATVAASRLKSNQIIYPATKNEVLWEWVPGAGLSGPFCPTHKAGLLIGLLME